ncbi:flagellar hook-length control protein FliK [Maritimibacter dapengensis]|uniref:Flagellar hook-length control protein FliK n=1 Tax=Maritimibacter dapengensis TaxID=2836868 RepID=A0ABS6T5C3_9RHOB|nr:flagellar hook-length control protein FliK [Maritimibacter dapengensis]MBV7380419.1 flagellar hook-length control protein FliK [Maritimibacter dapengensis]
MSHLAFAAPSNSKTPQKVSHTPDSPDIAKTARPEAQSSFSERFEEPKERPADGSEPSGNEVFETPRADTPRKSMEVDASKAGGIPFAASTSPKSVSEAAVPSERAGVSWPDAAGDGSANATSEAQQGSYVEAIGGQDAARTADTSLLSNKAPDSSGAKSRNDLERTMRPPSNLVEKPATEGAVAVAVNEPSENRTGSSDTLRGIAVVDKHVFSNDPIPLHPRNSAEVRTIATKQTEEAPAAMGNIREKAPSTNELKQPLQPISSAPAMDMLDPAPNLSSPSETTVAAEKPDTSVSRTSVPIQPPEAVEPDGDTPVRSASAFDDTQDSARTSPEPKTGKARLVTPALREATVMQTAVGPGPDLAHTTNRTDVESFVVDLPMGESGRNNAAQSSLVDAVTLARPETARHVVSQVADIVRMPADGRVEVTLRPEELGRLSLSFTQDAGTMNVSLSADRPETLELIRRNLDLLEQELRDMGFSNLAFDFGGGDGRDGPREDTGQKARVEILQPAVSDPADVTGANLRRSRHPSGGIDLRL